MPTIASIIDEAKNSICVSHMGTGPERLSYHLLPPKVSINRKLELELRFESSHSVMGCRHLKSLNCSVTSMALLFQWCVGRDGMMLLNLFWLNHLLLSSL